MKDCSCGNPLTESTFLSENFNHDGGTMFFKCECGKETYRSFLPTDMLTDEEKLRVIMEMGKELANIAVLEYRKIQSQRKLKNL